MKKINHIVLILILCVLFVFVFAYTPLARVAYFPLLGLLLVISYIFYRRKAKRDLYTTLFILLVFIASKLIFRSLDDITLIIRTASITSFFLIHLVLLIGPWSYFSDKIIKLYEQRRHLGVTVFLLGWLHASFVLANYFKGSIQNSLSLVFTFFGYTAFIITLFMALTSWDKVQKKIKLGKWKLIHAVTLLIYLSFVALFFSLEKSQNLEVTGLEKISIYFFIIFWIIVAPYKHLRIFLRTWIFGWKQLHVLIYIAYLSLLLHVYEAQIRSQQPWLKVIFFVSAAIVVGSHLAGWIKKFSEDKKINKKIKQINKTLNEGNKTYIGIAKEQDFTEGVGQKFYVDKKPIAVFRNEGKFIALSNICAHQKGPIYKGKIQYGYVECPWHYHQFSVKDGKGIPGFDDCIPYFETKIKDGIVFVATSQSFDCKEGH